jgi:hypothetical protein
MNNKYFVKVNQLWVTHSWSTLGKLQLSENQKDCEETISEKEIKWLKKTFGSDNVKVFKVALMEVE